MPMGDAVRRNREPIYRAILDHPLSHNLPKLSLEGRPLASSRGLEWRGQRIQRMKSRRWMLSRRVPGRAERSSVYEGNSLGIPRKHSLVVIRCISYCPCNHYQLHQSVVLSGRRRFQVRRHGGPKSDRVTIRGRGCGRVRSPHVGNRDRGDQLLAG